MRKVSLLAAIAVSCACIMACNNAPEATVEDTIVEDTIVVEEPDTVATPVETVAEPAPEKPAKPAAKKEVKKTDNNVATSSVANDKKSSNKVSASAPIVPPAQTTGKATETKPQSASASTKKVSANVPIVNKQ